MRKLFVLSLILMLAIPVFADTVVLKNGDKLTGTVAKSDGKTLVPQPHLRFDNKDMWTLDDVKGHTLLSPLTLLREMSPEAREASLAEYRKGFTINPCN